MYQSPQQLAQALARMPPAMRSLVVARMRQRRRVPPGGAWQGKPPAVTGWGLSSLFRRAGSAAHNPAGKLLISAVPGGASAQAAHAIASKALKSGDLKPEHLKKAGDLTKRGRAGDQGALMKIAQIKKQAGRGDRHAEVALDRLKLAQCLQTGGRCAAGRGGTLRGQYAAGADTMVPRGRPAKL